MKSKEKSTKKKFLVGLFTIVVILGGWFLVKRNNDSLSVDSNNKDSQYSASISSNLSNKNDNQDSDFDGLTDREEKIYGTNPNNPDTDNDTYLDGEEIANGYDPTIPSPNDKIDDVKSFLDKISPKIEIETPDESELNISLETGKEALEKYFQDAQTPDILKDDSLYQQAFLDARSGDTEKIDTLIEELKKSYQHLRNIEVPVEAIQIHKLTLAMIPPLIQLFEDLKLSQDNPLMALASIKASQELIPYTTAIQLQIDALVDKYDLEIPN